MAQGDEEVWRPRGKQPNRYFLPPCASGLTPDGGLRRHRRQNWEPGEPLSGKVVQSGRRVGTEKCVQGKHLSRLLTRRPLLSSNGGWAACSNSVLTRVARVTLGTHTHTHTHTQYTSLTLLETRKNTHYLNPCQSISGNPLLGVARYAHEVMQIAINIWCCIFDSKNWILKDWNSHKHPVYTYWRLTIWFLADRYYYYSLSVLRSQTKKKGRETTALSWNV